MSTRNTIVKLAVLSIAWIVAPAPALQAATSPTRDACIFDTYRVRSVAPLRGEINVGYGSYTTLRGAQLYVDAREGLTPEWLSLQITHALAKRAGTGGSQACEPAVSHIQVNVVSAGNGFWVQLSTTDPRESEALLRWARTMQTAATTR
jgi:hypothetical protein